MRQSLIPVSRKSWILGLIQTPELALSLCKKGLPTTGLVRWIPFWQLSQFYLFIALAALCRVLGQPW
jgi:hypothetical protein